MGRRHDFKIESKSKASIHTQTFVNRVFFLRPRLFQDGRIWYQSLNLQGSVVIFVILLFSIFIVQSVAKEGQAVVIMRVLDLKPQC